MLGDYVGDRALAATAARFACGLFVLSCLVLFAVPVFLHLWPEARGEYVWLSQAQRLLLFMVCMLPPASLVYCHWLLERRFPLARFDLGFAVKSLIALLLFLGPACLVVLRFHMPTWVSTVIAVAAVGPVLGLSEVVDEIPYVRVLFHAREVMWTRWRTGRTIPFLKKPRTASTPDSDPQSIARRRQNYYIGKSRIAAFQQTLSCPLNDAIAAAQLLRPVLANRTIEMLDLGGGEGTFTRNLLEELRNDAVVVSDLRMSDPVPWEVEYSANLSGLPHVAAPVVEHYHAVATAVRNDKFDLIVASHSLYALLDGAATTSENPIDELLAALRPGGALLVILASGQSHAYSFKSAALRRLFGVDPGDVVVEDIERGARRAPAKAAIARMEIDNVIDLTDCASHFEAGQPGALHEWLSYFLRVDVRGLEPFLQHELEFMLFQHTMGFPSVPHCLRQAHSSGKAVVLTDASVVLLHRTAALLWRA